eukprot:TRINITY_DN1034_c2_g2_i1.p1 TRINITY_DN1034_c2_g2~~TRINITY_DN1034_c2_g2_i1.p1  ORF type:complete len:231 (-),score=32.59 TRINITY_DN1034_c2_g2_i1:128-820(-)
MQPNSNRTPFPFPRKYPQIPNTTALPQYQPPFVRTAAPFPRASVYEIIQLVRTSDVQQIKKQISYGILQLNSHYSSSEYNQYPYQYQIYPQSQPQPQPQPLPRPLLQSPLNVPVHKTSVFDPKVPFSGTLLHWSVYLQSSSVLKYLIEAKADLMLNAQYQGQQLNVIQLAEMMGNEKILSVLYNHLTNENWVAIRLLWIGAKEEKCYFSSLPIEIVKRIHTDILKVSLED